MNKYIAYEGSKYTLEWYFTAKGESPAREYCLGLSESRQGKALWLFKLMGDHGKIQNEEKFRNEDDKIYAFKPKPDRFLCFFFIGSKIILTNAFEKKTNKLPRNEKERALNYKSDYLNRVAKGTYYD